MQSTDGKPEWSTLSSFARTCRIFYPWVRRRTNYSQRATIPHDSFFFFHIYNQLKWRKSNQKQVESRRRKTRKRYRMHCTMQSPQTTTYNFLLQSIRNPNWENQRPRRRKTKKSYRMHCTMQSPHTTTLDVLLQPIRNPNRENQRPFHLRKK
jgi:hypothetical protein